MKNNADCNIDNTNNHLILFTTKWFEKDTNNKPYFFSEQYCKDNILIDYKSSLYKQTYNFLKPEIIYNTIKKIILGEEFIGKIIRYEQLDKVDTDLAKKTFNKDSIPDELKDSYETNYINKFEKYSELKFIKGKLESSFKKISDAYPKGLKFLKEYILNSNLLKIDDIYKDNKNFSSRTKIWKIKNEEIYAYRCLDLGYDDEVLTVKNGNHPRERFITAILEDIARSKKLGLDELFHNYQITFVLHRDEINFSQVTKKLSHDEIASHLFESNEVLKEFNDKFKNVIVFQHDYGIIPEILTNSDGKTLSAKDIFNKIITYFKYRDRFNTVEKKTFKILNSDLGKLDIEEINSVIQEFEKETSGNVKLF